MTLLFFQNCISPHQIPYIKELCYDERIEYVHLIAPRMDFESRKTMGWNSSSLLNGTSIVCHLMPSDDKLTFLFQQNHHVVALFSGIRADKDVFRWFKLSLRFGMKRGIITEAPFIYHKHLLFHYLRFLLQDYVYVKYIQYVFAIGPLALSYFRSWNRAWQVYPFAYCTEMEDKTPEISLQSSCKVKSLFVGSVDKRKNAKIVLKALTLLNSDYWSLDIIGDGPEKKKLERIVGNWRTQHVFFHGSMSMLKAHRIMPKFDILILPSCYDGWGAVVNEALQCGLYVICSDRCGAKELLQDARCGCVFRSGDYKQLANIMQHCCSRISEIRADRGIRMLWAERCISGKVIARYMIDCLSGLKVTPPWQ